MNKEEGKDRSEVGVDANRLPFEKLLIKVDVIIAVYNAESTIEETVRSAMRQVIPDHLITTFGKDDALSNDGCVHFDVCVCCYDDASTDGSLDILRSLEGERTWDHRPSSNDTTGRETCGGTIRTKLLLGAAPSGTASRGAGYARNRAVKLRDDHETNANEAKRGERCDAHFLCVLDSDDVMHPTRIAEQAHAMLSLEKERRERTLMGCQFDRIPKDSTQHYARWANSLSDERLHLEQFRECTLLQPTWFLSKSWFERLGGYLEAPTPNMDEPNWSKRTKIDSNVKPNENNNEVAIASDVTNKRYYRLIHPSEIADTTISNDAANRKKRKPRSTTQQATPSATLRLAEDSRFFYAHLRAGGRLHLHRTPLPLVSYRHRSGTSQSSNTPRKLLLKLRAKAWEDLAFHGKDTKWSNGFCIWGAGRDGKDFLKALGPAAAARVVCFVDVDRKKIEEVKWYDNPDLCRRIPILHFSVLAKDAIGAPVAFGRIDKKCGGNGFGILSWNGAQSDHGQTGQPIEWETTPPLRPHGKNMKANDVFIDPEVLQQLPVVVCVAMYRTNGALESNVASIGRVEGKDLWHII